MGNYLSRSKSYKEDEEGISGSQEDKGTEDISCSKRSEGADSGFSDQSDLSSSMSSLTGLKIGDNITIRKHFRYLKTEVEDLRKLVDKCIEDDDMNLDDSDEIFFYKTRRQSVDAFIRKLLRSKPVAFNRFLTYLNESQQKHIADTLLQENKYPADLPEFRKTEKQMKASIVMNLDVLRDALEPDKDADFFVAYLVFTIDEYESIISHRYRRLQAEEMVWLIIKHVPDSYPVLMQLFRETNKSFMLNALDNVTVHENQDEINAQAIDRFRRDSRALHCRCDRHLGHFNMKLKLVAFESSATSDEHEKVKQINTAIEHINNDLKSLGCKLGLAEKGSIMIYLLNYGPLFQSRSQAGDDISKLLELMFLHPAVAKFGSYEGLRFNVALSVKSMCLESSKNCDEITKEAVEQNMDFLIEELGALTFISHKNAKKIFKKCEVDSVLQCEPPGRENRMRKLLYLILSKGKPALRFFKKVLKDERMFNVLMQISAETIQPSCTCSGYCMELLDEMSPLLILDEYRAMGIDDSVSLQLNNSQSRKDKSLIILKDAFEQEPTTIQKIVHILERNYPDFILGHSCSRSSDRYADTNWPILYEGVHEIKEKGIEINRADSNSMPSLVPNDSHSTKDPKAYNTKTNEVPTIVITENIKDGEDPSKEMDESNKSPIGKSLEPPEIGASTKSGDSGFYDS